MWKNDISGIYGIKEKETDEILYVGKAKQLKKQLNLVREHNFYYFDLCLYYFYLLLF